MQPVPQGVSADTPLGRLAVARDWAATGLGTPANWPTSLQNAASMCLESPGLLAVIWGPQLNLIYSNGWRNLLDGDQPPPLGEPVQTVFPQSALAERCRNVMASCRPAQVRHQPLAAMAGRVVYYLDHQLSPLRDEQGEICGVLAVSTKVDETGVTMDDDNYRTLLNAAAAGVAEADADGYYTYVNDRYCELVGRSRHELIGRMSFREVTYPDDVSQNASLIEGMTATGEPFSIEKRYLRPDGSIVWVNTYVSCLTRPAEKRGHFVAASIDISARKQAEDAARESEERKSFLLQLGDCLRRAADPVAVMDAAAELLGGYLGANRVSYGEIAPDGQVVRGRDYTQGVASLPRRFNLNKQAPVVLDSFLGGETCVMSDVSSDPRFSAASRAVCESVSIAAHVSVPISKNGRLVAGLGVHQAAPRQWTETEIALIEETAERTWAAVEQARAEAALRSSEARLSAIFAQAATGLAEVGLNGGFTHVNTELCRLLGRSRDQLMGLDIADVFYPEDRELGRTLFRQLVERGIPVSADIRCLRADGSCVYTNMASSRLDDEHGHPRAVLSVIVDISERKRAEAALAQELADNQRLQEVSTRLIPADDARQLFEELAKAAASIMRADKAVIHLFEKERDELKLLAAEGVSDDQRYVFARSAEPGSPCADALQLQQRVVVHDYRADPRYNESSFARDHLQTGVHAVQSTPLVSRSGGVLGVISTYWNQPHQPSDRRLRLLDILARQAADLVERHHSEAALRLSEERYRSLFTSIDEGFCVVQLLFDDEGKALDFEYLEVNPAFEKNSGLTDVVGKRMRELAPEHEPAWFEIFGRVALTGKPERFVNYAQALGRWFDVYAFRFGQPQHYRIAILFTDVSSRIEAEEELKRADRRKNEFLAMLAHELRNPLAPIRTGLEVLRYSQGQRETTEHMLELMGRQMQQMVRLVDDLLDISRITQGKLQIRRETALLKTVVDNALEGSRPFIGASDVHLLVNMPQQPLELHVDPARLAQVFSNLLNNAAKYTDAGGEVNFVAECRGRDLEVRVSDTGTGIPPEMLESVFDAFTQVEKVLDRSHGGLGVGLSLVKTLVELHGGSVTAFSQGPGQGSEFVVHLPGVVVNNSRLEQHAMTQNSSDQEGQRVLVVDDNEDAAEALSLMLQMLGHDVRTAHNGRDGLSLAEKFLPQLILLDLGMPEMDGYETVRQIRRHPWSEHMVVAALTGWGQEDDRRRTREAGFDYHLVKPVEQKVLNEVLQQLQRLRSN